MDQYISLGLWAVAMAFIVVVWFRRRRARIGPAAAATLHEMLSEDRRAAVEIILEERAAERDPEDRDGNLPDLANPTRKPRM